MKPIGNCRLCNKIDELQQSHILPAAAHVHTKIGGLNVLVKSRNRIRLKNRTDFKEHMLCFGCEQRISVFEGKAIEFCKLAWASRDKPFYQIPSNFVRPLIDFAYSVFWRSSVAECVTNYSLGAEIETELRDAFFNRDYPAIPRLALSLSFLKILDIPTTSRLLFTPTVSKLAGGIRAHHFSMFGIVFRIDIPSAFFELESEYFLRYQDQSGRVYSLQTWEQRMFGAELAYAVTVAERI